MAALPVTGPGPLATPGAMDAVYNITGGGSVKLSAGRLWSVVSTATGGTITLSDTTTGGTPGAGNELALTLTAGQVVTFPYGWPFATGINVVSVSAGTFALSYS